MVLIFFVFSSWIINEYLNSVIENRACSHFSYIISDSLWEKTLFSQSKLNRLKLIQLLYMHIDMHKASIISIRSRNINRNISYSRNNIWHLPGNCCERLPTSRKLPSNKAVCTTDNSASVTTRNPSTTANLDDPSSFKQNNSTYDTKRINYLPSRG